VHQRWFFLSGGEKCVLGVVELRPRKPLGTGHLALGQYPPVGFRGLHAAVLPDGGPETLEVGDGPLPELGVIVEGEILLLFQPLHVVRDPGVLPELL
jgi:hypothetical protein